MKYCLKCYEWDGHRFVGDISVSWLNDVPHTNYCHGQLNDWTGFENSLRRDPSFWAQIRRSNMHVVYDQSCTFQAVNANISLKKPNNCKVNKSELNKSELNIQSISIVRFFFVELNIRNGPKDSIIEFQWAILNLWIKYKKWHYCDCMIATIGKTHFARKHFVREKFMISIHKHRQQTFMTNKKNQQIYQNCSFLWM